MNKYNKNIIRSNAINSILYDSASFEPLDVKIRPVIWPVGESLKVNKWQISQTSYYFARFAQKTIFPRREVMKEPAVILVSC